MTRHGRPSGKGRFGKRPPSFTIDCTGHSCDNSNDSGLECDFGSESQLSWCSSEDSHMSRSSVSSIPACFNSSKGELSEESHLTSFNSNCTSFTTLNTKKSIENSFKNLGTIKMSPDRTDMGVSLGPFGQSARINNSLMHQTESLSGGNMNISPSSLASPVPVKRAKFSFPPPTSMKGLKLRNQNQNQNLNNPSIGSTTGKRLPVGTIPALATASLSPTSGDRRTHLQILAQPEEQHRARYQTEGSRGAIKDRKGNGFPTVKLTGYDKPATLQIFIGTDQGKVSPHMFYQACKVTGKSSTPCIEKKVEGTVLIEIEFEPSKEMVIGCDCVGILKERNVDVEQRFPFHHASQSRKKSTKCRMIFRTTIVNSMGIEETLQAASLPILCTQPPGLPEVCKQSLMEAPAKGGMELFLIGKNFLKDTKILFQEEDMEGHIVWESISEPQKDFLQQSHVICNVPAYKDESIHRPVDCKVSIVSGGKQSEPHRFTYLPNVTPAPFGVSNCVLSTQTSLVPNLSQTLTEGQQLEPVENQSPGIDMMTSGNETVVQSTMPMSAVSSATISGIQLCPTIDTMPLDGSMNLNRSPSTMEPLPALTFDTNVIPTTTSQERQVVNELRSILEHSVPTMSQNVNDQKSSILISPSTITSTMMDMKPVIQYPVLTGDQNDNANTESGVPLDLQFPSQVTATTSSSTISFTDQGINMNQFQSGASQMNCTASTDLTQMLNRPATTNLNMIPLSLARPFTTPALGSRRVQSLPPVTSASIHSMNESMNLVADCLGQGMLKTESVSPISVPMCVPSEGKQIVSGQVNVGNNMNFMGNDFQTHQNPITKALTAMSDNELINYINPNCFGQGAI